MKAWDAPLLFAAGTLLSLALFFVEIHWLVASIPVFLGGIFIVWQTFREEKRK